MESNKQRRYFAASNSADGFINYFPPIFSECQKLYVIKGGPGTGKSCLMKQVAARAEAEGYSVTYYACSSDPDSLDGIRIEEMNVGLLDATAPHVWEPREIGTVEQLIDLGAFWDSDYLSARREEIRGMSEKKRARYQSAYRYLAAYGQVMRAVADEMASVVDFDKLNRAAERLVKKHGEESGTYCERIGICDSVSMRGRVRLDTYEAMADTLYTVEDHGGVAHWFLEAIYENCRRRGVGTLVSRNAILPERVDALTMCATGVTFSQSGSGVAIHMRRFVKEDRYRAIRSEIRKKRAVGERLLDLAIGELASVRKHHFALEAIFSEAMDFCAKERFTSSLCKKIFGE